MSSEADDAAEPASGTEPEATVADDPQAHSSPTVLLLGAGENGHDLVVALQHLGAAVVAAESQPDAPAPAVAAGRVVLIRFVIAA